MSPFFEDITNQPREFRIAIAPETRRLRIEFRRGNDKWEQLENLFYDSGNAREVSNAQTRLSILKYEERCRLENLQFWNEYVSQ